LNILIPMIAAMIVIGAFCLGVYIGSRFCWSDKGRNTRETADAVGLMSEEEKQMILAQQKALAQCMSYSVDMAYGVKPSAE